jgi:hypothetical protein
MLRIATVAACAIALLAACGEDDDDAGGGAAPATKLTVTVWPEGRDGPKQVRTVECPGADVCGRLSVGRLAPVPRDRACTSIYGGPNVARVTGTIDGQRVNARFSREDGCEIDRWDRNAALLGPADRGP